MRTLLATLLIVAGGLSLAACGEPAQHAAPSKSVQQVEVMVLRAETVPAILEAPGTVQPRERIALASQISGFVREVKVRAGDAVAAGQVLVTLDARDADSQKAAAQAAVDEARAAQSEAQKGVQVAQSMRAAAKSSVDLANGTYARYQKLAESRSVTAQELDEVRARRDASGAELAAKEAMVAAAEDRLRQVAARIEQAAAQLRRADVYAGWSTVTAPSAGRIVERGVDAGSAVFPGTPLMVLESTARPQILATLPTTHVDAVRNGMEVRIRIPDQTPGFAQGRISEVIPVSTPGSHTIQFKVDLPAGLAAVSGSYVAVQIPTGTRQVILIPIQAVRETGQLMGVFVADSAMKARFRLVKATPYDSERMELLAGVEPGERIIVRLPDRLTDGDSLEIR